MTVVVALGGNALIREGERGTAEEQLAALRAVAEALRPVLGEPELVITHGNGPQVGNELLRQERAAAEAPPLPLWLAVAQTQAEIGALIEAELAPAAGRPVATILTHVLVDSGDPAFQAPTKPIGPFYDEVRARELERERGWSVSEDAGRGWRRIVPSPTPLAVVEQDAVRTLVQTGTIVVACGGGGIPVVEREGRLAGVDAVVDKDRASAVLAAALGARLLLILTAVDAVYLNFDTDRREPVARLSPAEAQALARGLPSGSMGAKVESAAAFARSGGRVLITSPERLEDALAGKTGTVVA